MLPVLIMILLIVFLIEVGVCIAVLLMLYLQGFSTTFRIFLTNYARLGLWVLIAMAPVVWVLIALVTSWFEAKQKATLQRVAEKPKAEKNIMTTPRTSPVLSEYERDDRDTEKQIEGLRSAYEEMKKKGTLPPRTRSRSQKKTPANDNADS
jgi:hypothetical protein